MADNNKNLSDDLNDMLDDAKDGAKKAAAKAEALAGEAKEKASEFADDAKAAAKDAFNDAKNVLSDGKNVAIIAHLWFIGLIIAFIMNSGNKKTEMGSFYIRQVLGLLIISLLSYIIMPFSYMAAMILSFFLFVLWIISLIGALGGNKKPVFLLGKQFQDWFKSL